MNINPERLVEGDIARLVLRDGTTYQGLVRKETVGISVDYAMLDVIADNIEHIELIQAVDRHSDDLIDALQDGDVVHVETDDLGVVIEGTVSRNRAISVAGYEITDFHGVVLPNVRRVVLMESTSQETK